MSVRKEIMFSIRIMCWVDLLVLVVFVVLLWVLLGKVKGLMDKVIDNVIVVISVVCVRGDRLGRVFSVELVMLLMLNMVCRVDMMGWLWLFFISVVWIDMVMLKVVMVLLNISSSVISI